MADTDIAYLSGFFDGEGSIGIYQGSFRPIDPVARPTSAGRKAYRWRLVGRNEIRRALRLMLPHLRVKHDEAALGLAFLAARGKPEALSNRGTPMFSAWQIAEQASFAEACKQLKAEAGRS